MKKGTKQEGEGNEVPTTLHKGCQLVLVLLLFTAPWSLTYLPSLLSVLEAQRMTLGMKKMEDKEVFYVTYLKEKALVLVEGMMGRGREMEKKMF